MFSRRLSALVVGAGVGGLAASIALASRGARVTLLDAGSAVGGKMLPRETVRGPVDAGPTVLTMRHVFDSLFEGAGRRLDDYVTLDRSRCIARHFWPDGSSLDLFDDIEESTEAVRAFAGETEARALREFMDRAERTYGLVKDRFIFSERPTMGTAFAMAREIGLRDTRAIDGFRTMWSALRSIFRDERLVQLFARYATYVGSSPFEAPATLNLIAHVESTGVWRVRGGMGALAGAMGRLATELGVDVRPKFRVERLIVEGDRVRGIEASGRELRADAIVWAGDVSAIRAVLPKDVSRRAAPSPVPQGDRSLSAVTFTGLARVRCGALDHHNVVFSGDYPREFSELLGDRRVPSEPTVYVCCQDRPLDPAGDRDTNVERVLVLVNAPATGDEPQLWPTKEKQRCERAAWGALERAKIALEPVDLTCTTPVDFGERFPATGGALYGRRATGPLSAFGREGSRAKLRGLYLAGGSVHPGAGVPMSTTSGTLAAAAMLADSRSLARSPQGATLGTTRTSSATTGT